MYDYHDELEAAQEFLEELRERGRERLEMEYGPDESIEAANDYDDGESAIDELLVAQPHLQHAQYASALQLSARGKVNAQRAAVRLGFRPWRRDGNGHQWYARTINGVPPGVPSAAFVDDEPDDEPSEAADDLSDVMDRIAALESRVQALEDKGSVDD